MVQLLTWQHVMIAAGAEHYSQWQMYERRYRLYSFTTKKFKSAGLKMLWNKHVICMHVCWTLLSLIHAAKTHYDIIPGV